ncbi:MAG: hypothetical protein ACFHU9_01650 [Fluviicola sp.]
MNDDLNNIVRSSFEDSGAEKAPESLWLSINSELEQREIDTIVKDSFEGQKDTAPEMVWQRVEDQLDIDRVWFNIVGKIKIRHYSRYLRFAAMLLLLLLPFNLDYNLFETTTVRITTTSTDLSSNDFTSSIDETNEQPQEEIIVANSFMYQSNVPNSSSKDDPKPNVSTHKATSDLTEIDTRLAILDLASIDNGLVPAIHPLISPKPKRSVGLLIGAVTSLENTWVLDNETRSGFDENSLVENEFSLGTSYGIFAEYQMKPRFSLTGEYLFQSRAKQHSHFYDNGIYSHKEQEINSYRLSLLAGWNTRPKFYGVSHSTVFRLGAYYSGVKSNYVQINHAITEVNTIRKQRDAGIRAELGKKVYLKSFALEGGIRANYGLGNLASQKSFIPSHLNFTRLVSGGLYLKAAYAF